MVVRITRVALGSGSQAHLRASGAPLTGLAGFTLSVIVSQPATVNCLIEPVDASATPLKAGRKVVLALRRRRLSP